MTPTEPSKKPKRVYQQHGFAAMKSALRKHGNRVLDRRTVMSRSLDEWKRQLITDLGGAESVSVQQLSIIEVAARSRLMLDSLDAWLLTQPSLINARRRSVYPVVAQRVQLADSLVRSLSLLGLERKARPALSLSEYLTKAGEGTAKAIDPATTDTTTTNAATPAEAKPSTVAPTAPPGGASSDLSPTTKE